MASQEDVRRIALALPGAEESEQRFAFGVTAKGKRREFAWVWLERKEPKKARLPNPEVLAIRVANLDEKALLLSMDPDVFFIEPHYNGYPAVLLRLSAVDTGQLEGLLTEAWRCVAPPTLTKTVADVSSGGGPSSRASRRKRSKQTKEIPRCVP